MTSCNKKTNPQTETKKPITSAKPDEGFQDVGSQAGPHVFIYKTKQDYFDKVPVILSEDKQKIVSFPHMKDLTLPNGEMAVPLLLAEEFLLDRRGINKDVAFLDITYEEYVSYDKVPDTKELFDRIIDSEPLVELWDCGVKYKYKDLEFELNELISNQDFSKFKLIYNSEYPDNSDEQGDMPE